MQFMPKLGNERTISCSTRSNYQANPFLTAAFFCPARDFFPCFREAPQVMMSYAIL
jgi:hypothetical protein